MFSGGYERETLARNELVCLQSQPAITCSKLTIETLKQDAVH